jgi:NAD(P)-dependent dehydrogenase (short-subunit alcohol dehydrogenase family)
VGSSYPPGDPARGVDAAEPADHHREFYRIDILIANAGIWTQAPFWELTEEQWEEMIGST